MTPATLNEEIEYFQHMIKDIEKLIGSYAAVRDSGEFPTAQWLDDEELNKQADEIIEFFNKKNQPLNGIVCVTAMAFYYLLEETLTTTIKRMGN